MQEVRLYEQAYLSDSQRTKKNFTHFTQSRAPLKIALRLRGADDYVITRNGEQGRDYWKIAVPT